jgi:hypothetical protein
VWIEWAISLVLELRRRRGRCAHGWSDEGSSDFNPQ